MLWGTAQGDHCTRVHPLYAAQTVPPKYQKDIELISKTLIFTII
jgi:hypothetical protein